MTRACSFPTFRRVAILAVVLFHSMVEAAEPEPTREARAHFDAGVDHLQRGSYAEAYREFKEAYAITPRWTVLGNMGIAAEFLERDGEAIDAMNAYLDRGGAAIARNEKRSVSSAIKRLEKGSAEVSLVAPGTFWIVDTRFESTNSVANEYGPFEERADLKVRGGRHEFKLVRASIDAPVWSATILGGDVTSHTFEEELVPMVVDAWSEPTERPEAEVARPVEPSHVVSYILWGTGTAGAIGATLILLESNRIQSDADAKFTLDCMQPTAAGSECVPTNDGDRKAARWRTGAMLTGIGAAGALIGGTVLYFVNREPSSTGAIDEAAVQPWLSPAGIGLSGRF